MKQKKILVIEDEKDVNENIKILLEEEGFAVTTVFNGRDGIGAAKNELPDLIICDIMMKGVDGYNVYKELSENKKTRSIPFIFLTAKVEKQDIRLGMQMGADDYILKPYKSDDLINSIKVRLKRINSLKSGYVPKTAETVKRFNYGDKIFAKIDGQPILIKSDEILFISAENQYCMLNILNGKTFLIRKSITSWEKILPEKEFLRIHRSTIINMEYIVKMEKWSHSSLLVHLNGVEKPFVISKRNSTKLRNNLF